MSAGWSKKADRALSLRAKAVRVFWHPSQGTYNVGRNAMKRARRAALKARRAA